MWDFSPQIDIGVAELFGKIAVFKDRIEGITLLGGEPLDQYNETLLLLKLCNNAGLSTMIFTGYELEEIHKRNMSEIIKCLDILITGRYDERKRTLHHQWIGSTNQEIHFLSSRYSEYKIKDGNYLEFAIDEDGSMTVLGFPGEFLSE